jgi:3,4-dihydroxy 2-butanone 4-phosphate synthase/GTP cyclohydrolase II
MRGHEGRGIGLVHKLAAYQLQDAGHDTIDANLALGLPADARDYGIGAQMLADLGVRGLRLMSNNPAKRAGLEGYGLTIVGRVALPVAHTPENLRYLTTKRDRMGHEIPGLPELPEVVAEAVADALAAVAPAVPADVVTHAVADAVATAADALDVATHHVATQDGEAQYGIVEDADTPDDGSAAGNNGAGHHDAGHNGAANGAVPAGAATNGNVNGRGHGRRAAHRRVAEACQGGDRR